MYKNLTITSAFGALAVILGAFGAHALKEKLSVSAMQSFETAVRYQLFHVLLIFFIMLNNEFSMSLKKRLSTIFLIGIVFFSGSIYAIHLAGVPAKSIWFITPLGGILFLVGWCMLTITFVKKVIKKE